GEKAVSKSETRRSRNPKEGRNQSPKNLANPFAPRRRVQAPVKSISSRPLDVGGEHRGEISQFNHVERHVRSVTTLILLKAGGLATFELMLANSLATIRSPLDGLRWLVMISVAAAPAFTESSKLFGAEASEKTDFNFQVRPILADRCFKCHGPDEKARKAKLRLDLPESAYAIRDPQTGKRAIVPRHPEQSELAKRITTSDDDDRMPPVASNLTLTGEEKEL